MLHTVYLLLWEVLTNVASKEHYNFNGQNGIMSKRYRYPPKKIPITAVIIVIGGNLQNIASSAAILKGCVTSSCKVPRNIKNTVKKEIHKVEIFTIKSSRFPWFPTKGFYSREDQGNGSDLIVKISDVWIIF